MDVTQEGRGCSKLSYCSFGSVLRCDNVLHLVVVQGLGSNYKRSGLEFYSTMILVANMEQFKIEQAAINSEATKQRALLQATIKKNKVEADRQFAEIMNALKALQPPTTLPEDTTTMIDTEKSGEDG
ncbi:hypothetical protein Tco_1575615 [Tanacetum coccineum]